jgi:hypothetical protein
MSKQRICWFELHSLYRGTQMNTQNGNGGLNREQRLQIMLSPEELEAVDTFRFTHRMPSRAAAVRELFRLGLSVSDKFVARSGAPSNAYGVIGSKDREEHN